jgi:general secretion pathway protein D
LADILKQLYGVTTSGSSKKVAIVKPTAKTGLAGELSGEVEIIPDETNNAIVFKATGRDYKTIKKVLKRLDIVPRQVLINVIIAEVTLSGSLEYGVQWFLKDRAQSNYKFQGRLDDGIDLPIDTELGSAGIKGLTLALYDSDDLLRGLITALETEGEVNILSSPNILAVDNKEAVIEVGEQVPIPTGETTTDTGTVRSIQYRDTGVLLTVTPHINSSGMIKIELVQEVSEIGTKDEDLEAFSFFNRKAQTSLVVEDGQTIILGGLMRSKMDASGSGVPFLRRIPLLGYLFGGTSKDLDKIELIFLLTPRVINTRAEADAITREFSQRVDTMKKLINKKEF